MTWTITSRQLPDGRHELVATRNGFRLESRDPDPGVAYMQLSQLMREHDSMMGPDDKPVTMTDIRHAMAAAGWRGNVDVARAYIRHADALEARRRSRPWYRAALDWILYAIKHR